MLVIASDLHLTDGTSGETIHSNAFRVFRERLRDLAYDASWRADGKYKPIEECHVVLVGDIFDVIRSCKWLDGPIRPWSAQDAAYSEKVAAITAGIIEHNRYSLDVLKCLDDGSTTTVPPATQDGKLAPASREPDDPRRWRVKVNIHYMVGNHDWFYHLPGPAYNAIRKLIVDGARLANPADKPFPHDLCESEDLQQVFREHRVFARHGDIFDSFNFEGNRNQSSLGDAIVVELLNRFPSEVAKQLGGQLNSECLNGLRELDNVRPLLIVPVWLDGLLRRSCTRAEADQIKEIWDKLVDCFLAVDFVKKHRSIKDLFGDLTKLEWALKFSKGVSLGNLSNLVSWLKGKLGVHDAPFFPNAFNEATFKDRSAKFIVYGHTHTPEIVPLDSTTTPNGVLNQAYINSGTWRAVHDLAQWRVRDQEFMGYHVMTYVAFYKDHERGGRPFETWSGTLATRDPLWS